MPSHPRTRRPPPPRPLGRPSPVKAELASDPASSTTVASHPVCPEAEREERGGLDDPEAGTGPSKAGWAAGGCHRVSRVLTCHVGPGPSRQVAGMNVFRTVHKEHPCAVASAGLGNEAAGKPGRRLLRPGRALLSCEAPFVRHAPSGGRSGPGGLPLLCRPSTCRRWPEAWLGRAPLPSPGPSRLTFWKTVPCSPCLREPSPAV